MADEAQRARFERLSAESQRLLAAIEELRGLEEAKRRELVGTPKYTALADEVLGKSRDIFELATRERDDGDLPEPATVSINEVGGGVAGQWHLARPSRLRRGTTARRKCGPRRDSPAV